MSVVVQWHHEERNDVNLCSGNQSAIWFCLPVRSFGDPGCLWNICMWWCFAYIWRSRNDSILEGGSSLNTLTMYWGMLGPWYVASMILRRLSDWLLHFLPRSDRSSSEICVSSDGFVEHSLHLLLRYIAQMSDNNFPHGLSHMIRNSVIVIFEYNRNSFLERLIKHFRGQTILIPLAYLPSGA